MRFFNQIKLKTPESIELEFNLAGIGNRTLALVIDNHVLWLTYLLVVFLLSRVLEFMTLSGGFDNADMAESSSLGQWLLAIFGLFSFFWFTGYFVLFETLWRGQTPGKRWVKIRVIGQDGRPLSMYQATLRALVRPIDDWLFIGFFMVLLGRQERRLGDLIANTIVIQDEQAIAGSKQAPFSGRAQVVAETLVTKADFNQLRPDDFAIIKEYLQRRQALEAKARERVSQQLMTQIQQRLHLAEDEFTGPADVFLEAVYLGYEQQLG
jgi:uncharacterized RDD family membrane protein YckC